MFNLFSKKPLTPPCRSEIFAPHTVTLKHKNIKKMRTKTLLLGVAAALAAGLTASQAQTVYSQNVVGYMNITVPASSYAILANQLQNGTDTAQTNNSIQALITGFVSDPAGPPNGSNSVYFQWAGNGYNNYYYFNETDANIWWQAAYGTYPAGWYDLGGDYAAVQQAQGQGAFIQNASKSPMTITVVGTVLQGTNNITIKKGYNLLSLAEPISTNVTVAGYGLPSNLTSDPNGPPSGSNDVYFQWAGNGYNNYYWFNEADVNTWWQASYGTYPAGWYDLGGSPMPAAANPQVGQGFFLLHNGAAITWTNTFTVQ
jgi:hypothetical protein